MTDIGPNDSCLCGSGKKWKRCHDPNSAVAKPASPKLPKDERVDETLFALGLHMLQFFEEALVAIKIHRTDRERRLAEVCLAFYAIKLHRVSLAGVTLIRHGQGMEALTLKREQYYYWLAMQYYSRKQDQAVLFMASQPMKQRNSAQEIAGFDPAVAADPKRQEQLAELIRQSDEAYDEFPGLKRPKGKSGNTSNPVLIDWSEPDARVMLDVLAEEWIREDASAKGVTLTDEEFKRRVKRIADRTHFFHADAPSKDKHGTPLALNSTLDFDPDFTIRSVTRDEDDPNELLWIYLQYPLGVLNLLCKFNDLEHLSDRYNVLHNALFAQRERFGFAKEETGMLDFDD